MQTLPACSNIKSLRITFLFVFCPAGTVIDMKNFSAILFFTGLMIHSESGAQVRRFYIANDDHTDYVWSANEAVYKKAMLTTLDKYLFQIDSTIAAGLPFRLQAKYNCDGSFWFWLYEKNRNAAQMNNLVEKVKSGHVTIPYNPVGSVIRRNANRSKFTRNVLWRPFAEEVRY